MSEIGFKSTGVFSSLGCLFLLSCSGGGGQSAPPLATSSGPIAAMVFPNNGDSSLATFTTSDGKPIMIAGTKDSQGFPTSLTKVVIGNKDLDPGKDVSLHYDAQGRILSGELGTGESIDFSYPSATTSTLTIKDIDGTILETIDYDDSTGAFATRHASISGPPNLVATKLLGGHVRADLAQLDAKGDEAHSVFDHIAQLIVPSAEAQTPSSPIVSGSIQLTCGNVPSDVLKPKGYFDAFVTTLSPGTPLRTNLQFSGTGGIYSYSFNVSPFSAYSKDQRLQTIVDFLGKLDKTFLEPICGSKVIAKLGPTAVIAQLLHIIRADPLLSTVAVATATRIAETIFAEINVACTLSGFAKLPSVWQKVLEIVDEYGSKGTLRISTMSFGGEKVLTPEPLVNPKVGQQLPNLNLNVEQVDCVEVWFEPETYTVGAGDPVSLIIRKRGDGAIPTDVPLVSNTQLTGPNAARIPQHIDRADSTEILPLGVATKTLVLGTYDAPNDTGEKIAEVFMVPPVNARLDNSRAKATIKIRFGNTLTVTKVGDGQADGRIHSDDGSISCGITCRSKISKQTVLSASDTAGSRFKQWGGDCSGNATTCTLDPNTFKNVTAEFEDIAIPSLTKESMSCTRTSTPPLSSSGLDDILEYQLIIKGKVTGKVNRFFFLYSGVGIYSSGFWQFSSPEWDCGSGGCIRGLHSSSEATWTYTQVIYDSAKWRELTGVSGPSYQGYIGDVSRPGFKENPPGDVPIAFACPG